MSYNSNRPVSSYSYWELAQATARSLAYYGTYIALYVFFFKPRRLWRRQAAPAEDRDWFETYADHYYPRPEFAYFKADEGRCFHRHLGEMESPRMEIGYEDGRISAYHTGNLQFDAGLEYDAAVIGQRPLFDHYSRLVGGSFQEIPFPSGSFKTIVAIHVLDHIPDLSDCLSEAARVLSPGGCMAFSLFSGRAARLLGAKRLARLGLHHFFSLEQWRDQLHRHGFDLVAYEDFTCSELYLRLYFLGMGSLVSHDRSLVFSLLLKHCPLLARMAKRLLKDITYCIYFERFMLPNGRRTESGCNGFILARKRCL